MIKSTQNINIAKASVFAMFFFVASCKNDVKEVHNATHQLDLPLRVQYGIHYEYTDSAKKILDLHAKEAVDYSHKKEPYREFPQGIEVTFFNDSTLREEAYLRSNYAKQFDADKKWEARGDVVVRNHKGDQLNTEHLLWDQRKHLIYSDKYVTFTTDGSTFEGRGFEADENFDSWRIIDLIGEIELKEEDLENDSLQ